MSNETGDFTDSLVVVYDNDNNFIAKTIVKDHDRRAMVIETPPDLGCAKTGARLNLLIIHAKGASDFCGVVRRTGISRCEISLFSERPRQGREAIRHTLNAPAIITKLIIDSEEHTPREPLDVIIENLSVTGALVNSPVLYFDKGTVLHIEFHFYEKDATIYAKVVREQLNSDNSYSFGCRLLFQGKD